MLLFFGIVILVAILISTYFKLGYSFIFIAASFSIIMNFIAYYHSDKIALMISKAKRVSKEQAPNLYKTVEKICEKSKIPIPKIYIIPDTSINAFACGRNPKNSSIAVTEGALQKLEESELEGVIAHEISHIKNYDIRLMTIVVVLLGIVSILVDIAIRASFFGLGSRRRNENDSGILSIFGLIAIILAPIIAQLIKLAISRKREFLADASAALITNNPNGLADALEKIALENKKFRMASQATAHLFISNPFGIKSKNFISTLFSTHPPIEQRIKILRNFNNYNL